MADNSGVAFSLLFSIVSEVFLGQPRKMVIICNLISESPVIVQQVSLYHYKLISICQSKLKTEAVLK